MWPLLLPAHTAASPLAPLGTAAAAAGVGAGIAAAAPEQQQQGDEMLLPAAVAWVWAGMVLLMLMRAATILLPLACRWVAPCSQNSRKKLCGQHLHADDVK